MVYEQQEMLFNTGQATQAEHLEEMWSGSFVRRHSPARLPLEVLEGIQQGAAKLFQVREVRACWSSGLSLLWLQPLRVRGETGLEGEQPESLTGSYASSFQAAAPCYID